MAHGGPVSAPCTSLDLDTAIVSFYNDPEVAEATGWVLDDASPGDLVQGLLHVDDSLIMSKVFCYDCLLHGVEKLWPQDVGASLEGKGARIPFLHVELQIGNAPEPAPIRAVPLSHNRAFAQGQAAHPAFATLPPYVGAPVTVQRHLAAYAWCRLAAFSQTLRGTTELAAEPLADLLAEMAQLGWPRATIAAVRRRFPRTHASDFATLVRTVGVALRKATAPQHTGGATHEFFMHTIGGCLATMWAQAGVAVQPALAYRVPE